MFLKIHLLAWIREKKYYILNTVASTNIFVENKFCEHCSLNNPWNRMFI